MRGEFSCLEACCQAGCLGKPLEKVHQPFFWRAKHCSTLGSLLPPREHQSHQEGQQARP